MTQNDSGGGGTSKHRRMTRYQDFDSSYVSPVEVNTKAHLPRHLQEPYNEGLGMDDPIPTADYGKRVIKCRLEQLKYTSRKAAEKRCKELHGTTFEGSFQTARYWVFYTIE